MKLTFVSDLRYQRLYASSLAILGFFCGLSMMFVGGVPMDLAQGILLLNVLIGNLICLFTIDSDGKNWAAYRQTLPTARRGVVLGRYASIAVMNVAGLVFSLVVTLIVVGIAKALTAFSVDILSMQSVLAIDWIGVLVLTSMYLVLAVVSEAICVPVVMGFGTKWGLLSGIALYITIFVVLVVLDIYTPVGSAVETFIANTDTAAGMGALIGAFLGICVVAYLISMAAAVKLYGRREL